MKVLRRFIFKIIARLRYCLGRILGQIALQQVNIIGKSSRSDGWFTVTGNGAISLNSGVFVGHHSLMACAEGRIIIESGGSLHQFAELRSFHSDMLIAEGATVCSYSIIKTTNGLIKIGKRVWIAQNCIIEGMNVDIGDDCILAPYVHIVSGNHRFDNTDIPINQQGGVCRPIQIGRDCWLGSKAVVVGGVTIGEGTVIGAGSVVTKNIPPYSVAAGVPAMVIRSRLKSTAQK